MTIRIHILGIDDEGNQIDLLFSEDDMEEVIIYLNSLISN